MSATTVKKRTFSISAAQSRFIDKKVKSGAYASASEVIREGLRKIEEDEAEFDAMLRAEVLPAWEEYQANPASARPADEVFDELLRELRHPLKKAS